MRNTALSTVVVLAFAFVATPAHGSTIDVRVLSATYSVTVRIGGHPEYPAETKTSTHSSPVSESLSRYYVPLEDPMWGVYGEARATATADLLDVVAAGFSELGTSLNTSSYADTQWTFSPLVDGVADFSIHGGAGVFSSPFSATLFDVTTNTQMWEFSQVGWVLSETVYTFLHAEHVYAMHLSAQAHSSADGVLTDMHVSGIRAVPENADSFVCLCMGLLVALLGKWKLQT